MDIININKLVRYSVILVGIFALLKLIPSAQITTKDALISTCVLFALYVLVENVFIKSGNCSNETLDGSVSSMPSMPSMPSTPSMPSMPSSMPNTQQISSLFDSVNKTTSNVNSPIVQNPASSSTMSSSVSSSMSSSVSSSMSSPMSSPMSSQSSPYNTTNLKPGECKDCVKRTIDSEGMESYKYRTDTQKYDTGRTRSQEGVMKADNEMQYTDYFIMPITAEDEGSFEEGYSMLPPSKWYPVPPHPPVCVTEKQCPVCPVLTSGAPVDLKEWNDSRRITPGDVINIDYAKDKMNSGR